MIHSKVNLLLYYYIIMDYSYLSAHLKKYIIYSNSNIKDPPL